MKGLDSALPERRERKRGAPMHVDGARGGKRRAGGQQQGGNHNGSGAARGGERRPGQPRRNTGGVQKSYKGILDDPAEKAKAEARARKFGLAQ